MDVPRANSTSLFDVYLRLRPSHNPAAERFLDLDDPSDGNHTHITVKPPSNDHRKRAIEKFGFTRVFEEAASQRDVFDNIKLAPLIEGVIVPEGKVGKDTLVATLGMTGSGKSHTILGSKSQRGLTQMALDTIFKSVSDKLTDPTVVVHEIAGADVSEAQVFAAPSFLDSLYGGGRDGGDSRTTSRAQTPMMETNPNMLFSPRATPQPQAIPSSKRHACPRPSATPEGPSVDDITITPDTTAEYAIVISMYEVYNDRIFDLLTGSALNNNPQQQNQQVPKTPAGKDHLRRRPLLFKNTEWSPDRKVVAGLRKVVCGNLEEALSVLETGLTERRVAGTGSNAVSSRSHGFFVVDVMKRTSEHGGVWAGNSLTVVDLAGSERARVAKTGGSTLAEAGKINESLMYLGQCMQMQSDNANYEALTGGVTTTPKDAGSALSFTSTSTTITATGSSTFPSSATTPSTATAPKPGLVPFRQCKLTELLFSNVLQQPGGHPHHHHNTRNGNLTSHIGHAHHHHNHNHPPQQQKAIMIVTADARSDFNATSQILRYSALAREVTVPRIPSVTSTILSQQQQQQQQQQNTNNNTSAPNSSTSSTSRPDTSTGIHDPNSNPPSQPQPQAQAQIASLTAELTLLRHALHTESSRRQEAESSLVSATQALEETEETVRAECWDAFEKRMADERERWMAAMEEMRVKGEEFVDGKVGLVARSAFNEHDDAVGNARDGVFEIFEDENGERAANRGGNEHEVQALRRENEVLNEKVRVLSREKENARTPSRGLKVKTLKGKPWDAGGSGGTGGGGLSGIGGDSYDHTEGLENVDPFGSDS